MAAQEVAADILTPKPELSPDWVRYLVGPAGVSLAFLWGLAEGTFFFVVPDVVLSLVSMLDVNRAWRHIVAALAGAVLAGAMMFSWSARDSVAAGSAVARVPFVTPRMFGEVETSYHEHGAGAMFRGPLKGIPYKVYAVHAPSYMSEARFLAATAPARAERFIVVWAAFGLVGTWLRRVQNWSPRKLAKLHAGFWIAFYALYWGAIGMG